MSDKIYINKVGNVYWYSPSIWTFSKRKWQSRPYKTLKKLLINEKFYDEEIVISLNKDKDFRSFLTLQQYKKMPLSFKKIDLEKIVKDKFIIKSVEKTKVKLIFDLKSLKLLRNGYIPFYSVDHLKKITRKDKYLIWRKDGYINPNEKILNKYQIGK